ncbi:hypothetical protein B0H17DRAFT_1302047 [Mycena rosella]|uniref:Uncharacterized protein n=1 Tax=Mycena rosella TaxID=1033263 RepID=A0AAD7M7P4_MYCRO|nr:hypothetical protein B0H17DRAFT_1302047 [Mycena rosella]
MTAVAGAPRGRHRSCDQSNLFEGRRRRHSVLFRCPESSSVETMSFLPIPSPPPTSRFKCPKKKASQQDDVPPLPSIEPLNPEIKLDPHFDEMDGNIDRTILSNGGNDASSPSSGFASSHSHSDSSQFGSPLKFNNPFLPSSQLQSVFYQPPRKPSRKVLSNTIVPLPGPPRPRRPRQVLTEGGTAPESSLSDQFASGGATAAHPRVDRCIYMASVSGSASG